ncbi:MAG: hypothetical protein AAGB29_08670 [Planctomycetota bacterium]
MSVRTISRAAAASVLVAPCSLASSLYGVDFEVEMTSDVLTGVYFGSVCFESDTFPVDGYFFTPDSADLTLTFDFVSDTAATPATYTEMDDSDFPNFPRLVIGDGLDYRVVVESAGAVEPGGLLEFEIDGDGFWAEFAASAVAGGGTSVTTHGRVSYSEVYRKGEVVPTPVAAAMGLAAIVGLAARRERRGAAVID